MKGHGKPVDIWSIGIIAYVMLCGYTPFRSDDVKILMRETSEAKIEFQERYWKNISQTAKDFIKRLLHPDPAKRPTAEEASNDRWLAGFHPEGEHDLSDGLRDHFDPRARWKAAIASARVLSRLGSIASRNSTLSSNSGGWIDSDDEQDEDEGAGAGSEKVKSKTPPSGSGSDLAGSGSPKFERDHTASSTNGEEKERKQTRKNSKDLLGVSSLMSVAEEVRSRSQGASSLDNRPPTPVFDDRTQAASDSNSNSTAENPGSKPRSKVKSEEDEDEDEDERELLRMPGSFDFSNSANHHGPGAGPGPGAGGGESWIDMLRNLRLTQ
ncbi:hypothetical protein H0H93_007991 [Arthromyces matolae]|nr:hypothetical protein H0H93_007991 [Arthromyces matolae]